MMPAIRQPGKSMLLFHRLEQVPQAQIVQETVAMQKISSLTELCTFLGDTETGADHPEDSEDCRDTAGAARG